MTALYELPHLTEIHKAVNIFIIYKLSAAAATAASAATSAV